MNIIDTRDLYKRQQELQSELESLQDAVSDAQEALEERRHEYREAQTDEEIEDAQEQVAAALEDLETANHEIVDWQSEYQEELDEINALESEIGDEWMHGATLIDEDDFIEYVQDLAEELGATAGDDHCWLVIDWEATANNVQQDYSSCEYQGTTYLFRS